MKRVLIALFVLVPSLASAQVSPYPLGVSAPIFGLPASAVNGGGGFSPQLLGPESCTVPAYSFITAPTNGWGGSGTTTACAVIGGTQRLGVTSTAVTSTVPYVGPLGTEAATTFNFGTPGTGLFGIASSSFAISMSGTAKVGFFTGAMQLESAHQLAWASSVVGGGSDLMLTREAAAVLQLGLDAAGVTDQMFKAADRITSDGGGANFTLAGGRNRGASAGGSIIFQTSPAAGAGVTGTLANAAIIDSTGAFTLVGKVVAEGAIGVPVVAKVGRITAQSSNATIATLTTPAVDGSYEVSANMNVTASTTLITTLTCTYTDESNTARTMILPVAALAGSFIAGGAITGAGASVWETPMMHIRVKASTAITILTSAGTFTGVTYTADAVIKQMK